MPYRDLRDFIAQLEQKGELKRITVPVDTHLEMTEIADRVLRAQGPALLFEKPVTKGVALLAVGLGIVIACVTFAMEGFGRLIPDDPVRYELLHQIGQIFSRG